MNAPPRFVINALGIAGELVDYHWYRVHQLGCCGPSDDWVYYSASTGRELFTSSLAPPIFFTLSGTGRRWIAVHDSYSAFASAEMNRDSTTAAVIQFGDGVEPSRRIVVRGTRRYSFNVDSLAFRTTFPRRDAGPDLLDPIPNEGVSIVLVLSSPLGRSPDRTRIEVPITNGSPDLERANLPAGFTIHWSDTRP